MTEPAVQVVEHLVVISELLIVSETMTSTGIDEQGTVIALTAHGRIVGDAIGEWWHATIVVGQQDDGRWCQVSPHLTVVAKKFDGLLIVALAAEEVFARPLVLTILSHRDDRIKKDTEIGARLISRMGGHGRGEVSAG